MTVWETYDDTYKQASGESSEVAEGKYQARVVDLDIATHPRFGSEQLRWELAILEGPETGHTLLKWGGLNARFIRYVTQDLNVFGVVLEKFSDLETRRHEIIGRCAEVAVMYKENGGFKNQQIYFDAEIESHGLPELPPKVAAAKPGTVEDPDDIPF